MNVVTFKPNNVCTREMTVEYDDSGLITKASVVGGCNGNLQAVCRLIEGRNIDSVISTLKGIKCRGSRTGQTSCPDQLALGLEANIK